MVVSSLLAVISMTTYAALAGGVRVWKRVEASIQEVDLAIGWKRFRKDLANQIPVHSIGFYGTADEVAFPGLVTVKEPDGLTHEEVGRIRYLFEESSHQICREETTFTDSAQGGSDCRPIFLSVGKVSFEYYGLWDGFWKWQPEWKGSSPPIAVRLKIALEGAGGEGGIAKQYTATLPY